VNSIRRLASYRKIRERLKVFYRTFLEEFNPLNAEINPICHMLALLGAHHIFHVSGLRVKG
jgi:hypothetical protein